MLYIIHSSKIAKVLKNIYYYKINATEKIMKIPWKKLKNEENENHCKR